MLKCTRSCGMYLLSVLLVNPELLKILEEASSDSSNSPSDSDVEVAT